MSRTRDRWALIDDDDDGADASSTLWGTGSGPSFIDRARGAPDDNDGDGGMDVDGGERDAFDARFDEPYDRTQGSALQQLFRAWTNERHAPDILPAQDALLGGLLDHIRRQVRDSFYADGGHI
jgi:GINS complex subunit 4